MKSLWQSVCDQTEAMANKALMDVDSIDDWTRIKSRRRREFMHSLGLDPLPDRCDLKRTEYGAFEGKGFTARRIAFQVLPDCWSSACLYTPDPQPRDALPGVLYVCGHAAIGTWHYQYHPILWARRGYACLILDTIEQNDNPGEHHAYVMGKTDGQIALGYTPAGMEVWNAMRALDVLAADPRVDPERLAVTGVSGGGACSFHTAIADDRIKAVSTLCGISSPVDALRNQHLNGHCECMYPVNLYQRDISEFGALLAPRAALFCFADDDVLFNPEETAALVDRIRKVYRLHGKEDLCAIVTCPGAHGDHAEFDEATSQWVDRHVAGEERPLIARGERELPETVTCVFNGAPPAGNRVHLLPELMTVRGTPPLPRSAEEWPDIRRKALASLPPMFRRAAGSGDFTKTGEWKLPESTLRLHHGQMEGVELWLQSTIGEAGAAMVLSVANEGENHRHAFAHASLASEASTTAIAALMPRMASGILAIPGPEILPPGSWLPSTHRVLRKGLLLTGMTPVLLTLQDLRAAVDYLFTQDEMQGRELYLYGRGDGGVAALYQALVDERVAGVLAEDIVSSHIDGSPIPGILRSLDLPHAVGLIAPRPVALVNAGHNNWNWPTRAYERLGCPERLIMAADARTAIQKMIASGAAPRQGS